MLKQEFILCLLAVLTTAQDSLTSDFNNNDIYNNLMESNFGGQQGLSGGSLRDLQNDQALSAVTDNNIGNLREGLMTGPYMGSDIDRSMQFSDGLMGNPGDFRNDQGLSGLVGQQQMSSLDHLSNLDDGLVRTPYMESDLYRSRQFSNGLLDNLQELGGGQRLPGLVDQQQMTTLDPLSFVGGRQISRLGNEAFDSQINYPDIGNKPNLFGLADEQRMSTINSLNDVDAVQVSPFSSGTVDSAQNYGNLGNEQLLTGSFYQPLINALRSLSGIVSQRMARVYSDSFYNQDNYPRDDQYLGPRMDLPGSLNENTGVLPREFPVNRENSLLDRSYMPTDSLSSQYFSDSQTNPSMLFNDIDFTSRMYDPIDPNVDGRFTGSLTGFPTSGFENNMQFGERKDILNSIDSQSSMGQRDDMSRLMMAGLMNNLETLRSSTNMGRLDTMASDPSLTGLATGIRDVFEEPRNRISLTPQSRRMEGSMELGRTSADLF